MRYMKGKSDDNQRAFWTTTTHGRKLQAKKVPAETEKTAFEQNETVPKLIEAVHPADESMEASDKVELYESVEEDDREIR
ncbi:hypothetical protein L596_001161 [Steinernema carpocapsae]|uniref:Uncharacterized protein n=1 Tax=Steinernema carpocapsae TaxID=34508 RepID=A0A4U8UMV5_STECR|nr:hypothetical protein L596_001161 [Steinernema carpocapsae]